MDADELAIERRHQFFANWEGYSVMLFLYILKKIRNRVDAEDLAVQTLVNFLVFMEGRQWQEDIRSVTAYLKTIARNLCVEWLRRHGKEMSMDHDDEQGKKARKALERDAVEENNPTSRLEEIIRSSEEFHSRPLKIILGGLSEYELRLLYMHAVDEMKAEEIATAVSGNVDSVRYQLNKLYAKIRYRVGRLGE